MRIDLVSLCDAAVEVHGRLHVLGSIDYFWAASVPYIHPQCALVARLRWSGHEPSGKHKIRVQIMDADGYSIAAEYNQKFSAPGPAGDDIPLVRHLILNLQSLRFASYGPHAIRIEVDGAELACLPFSLVRMGRSQQQQSAR